MPDDFQPPRLTEVIPETGQAFALTDESFSRWWDATILPEDAHEFVHLHRGTIDEARYACALDYLVSVQRESLTSDLVIKAYCLAQNRPLDLRDATLRINATYLAQSDAVSFLADRVRSRSRRIAEERIANRTVAKIEELYARSGGLEGKEQLDTERAALETSIKYLGNQSRERAQEADRRTKKAIADATKRSQEQEGDMRRLPSLAEARLHLAMLVDGHGPDAIRALVADLSRGEHGTDS